MEAVRGRATLVSSLQGSDSARAQFFIVWICVDEEPAEVAPAILPNRGGVVTLCDCTSEPDWF